MSLLTDQDRVEHDYEIRIQLLMSAGARSREQAIGWILEADDHEDPREYAEISASADAEFYGAV